MKKHFVLACFLLMVTACFETQKNPQRTLSPLSFSSGSRQIDFEVETSLSPQEMALGLMYRKSMPKNQGMIFTFSAPQRTAFWMKNTYLPLDMIFVGKSGRISYIAENVAPLSENLVYSPAETIAVIELNAGTCAELGIKRGMKVSHQSLDNLQK